MALGADPTAVLREVLGRALRLTAGGVAIGLLGALVVTRVLASLLFGVTPTDPPTFLAVAGALGAVALAASYLPARAATRVDPVTALRAE